MPELLPHLVSRQAEARPESIAIVLGEDVWTYGDLERVSNQLARALIESGCRKGDRVCLLDRGRLLFDGPVSRGLDEYSRVVSIGAQVGAPAEAERSDQAEGGWHRVVPGGQWAESGEWAFQLLREEGLQPTDSVRQHLDRTSACVRPLVSGDPPIEWRA